MTSSAVLAEPTAPAWSSRHVVTITPFYPSTENPVGGCFLAEALRHLKEVGVLNTVFAVDPVYRPATISHPDFPSERIRFFSFPRGIGLPSSGRFLFGEILGKIRALHHHRQIDLIHAHSTLPCGYAALLISRELNLPFVVSVHGLDVSSRRQVGGASGWLCERVSRSVFAAASRVICVSEKVQERVRQIEPNARTNVVYNGVDCKYFRPSISTPQCPSVLAIGNLIEEKGFDSLLRAFAVARQKVSNVRCQIIGVGSEERRLRALAVDLGIARSVEWLGRQGRSQVAAALGACTVFALPSYYEALGCVYLEAMACGKPVIGCRGQGIDEVIQHGVNGWIVEPENDRDLTEQLLRLLEDEALRQRTGLAARQTILNSFSLQHQAERLSRLYEECLS